MFKRVIFKRLSLAVLVAASYSAATPAAGTGDESVRRETVNIRSVRFADALLRQWVAEYVNTHPEVALSLTGKDAQEPLLEVAPFAVDSSAARHTVVAFGSYAILPIAGKDNTLPDEIKKKKLNEKRLKELFFEKNILDDDYLDRKEKPEDVTVYSGNGAYSLSRSFAGHFGYQTSSLKGKKIAGDDIYLNSAVKKDVKGVSFNNLNYIFNIESRQLNEGIVLLPLDVKKEYAEILNVQNLDETIALLENKDFSLIPKEKLAFVLPEEVNQATLQFLEWTLSEGQSYLHSFGFLRLDEKTLDQQRKQISALETKLLANQ